MKLPDGPTTWPLMQSIQVALQPFEFTDHNVHQFGDPYTSHLLGFPPTVIFGNPQAFEEIFATQQSAFDVNNFYLEPLLGKQSVLLLNGNAHQRHRKLLMPPFHGERMKAYGDSICSITREVCHQWNPDKIINIQASIQEISLQVILRVIFGIEDEKRFQTLKRLLSSLLNLFNSSLYSSLILLRFLQFNFGPWRLFLQLKQQIDELIYAEIRERRNQKKPLREDILSLLLLARDEAEQPLTDEELRDELITLLVAGQEATVSGLGWAFYWIHHLPQIQQMLRKELQAYHDNFVDNLTSLTYLSAVCNETLRIHPIATFAFPRVPKHEVEIGGYVLTPDVLVCPSIYLVHQREDIYPQPKQFRPERFLERQFSPYEYLPFGGGNRRCIGAAFALFEMKIILATILSNYQLELMNDRPIKSVRRGVNFGPSETIQFRLK
jgi:cytochrome P450 family 110